MPTVSIPMRTIPRLKIAFAAPFKVTTLLISFLSTALCVAPITMKAQQAEPSSSMVRDDRWRVTLTIFRSPGTGIQLSRGHLAAFVAHYPTIFERDGEQRTTQFVRLGVAWYVAPEARTSPYVSLSYAPSLTKGWSNSALADVGVRQHFTSRLSGQLGVALLYAPKTGATRVNPTVGLGVHF